jgi:hypothetical protein
LASARRTSPLSVRSAARARRVSSALTLSEMAALMITRSSTAVLFIANTYTI